MRFQRTVLAALVTVLAVSAALAQSGGMRVTVYDGADKSPLPGVTVTLRNSQQLVATTTQLSDRNGVVEFPVLRAGGGYSVEVSFPGYAKQMATNLKVEISKVLPLTFTLSPEITEKVIVKGARDKVDLEKSSTSTKFGEDFIQDLPIQGRLYQNVLTLTAGVQDADGDGNPNVHGARSRDFKTQVNGVSNQDPLTGEWMSLVNADSIEEVEVITAGAGVEYGRAQGGFAQIIQKQGTNDLEGVVNLLWRSSRLDGDAAAGVPGGRRPQYDTYQPSFSVSGPLVKDKLWYRLSHELIRREDPVNIISDVAVVTTDRTINSDQLTWQVSPRNKLALSFQYDPLKITNLGVSSLTPPESSYTLETGGPQYTLSWTAPYSSKVLIDSLISYQNAKLEIAPSTTGVKNTCVSGLGLPFLENAQCANLETGQTTGSFFQDWKDRRERFTAKSQATIYGGRFLGMNHQFKIGLSVENERYSLDLERRPNIAFFIVRQTNDAESGNTDIEETAWVVGNFSVPRRFESTASGTSWGVFLEDQVKPRQNLTITLGLRVDRESIYSKGYKPFSPKSQALDFLLARRDLRRANPNLPPNEFNQLMVLVAQNTFTAYEGLNVFTSQLARELGLSLGEVETSLVPTGVQNQFWNQTRRPDNVDIVNTNFAPRLSIAWDPWSDGKTKFALTAGRYFDKIFLAVPLLEVQPVNTNIAFRATRTPGRGFVVNGLSNGINPAINTSVVDRGLKTPYQDEITFSFEREIAQETTFRATYIYRRFENQLQDFDLNYYGADYGRCLAQSAPGDPVLALQPDGNLDDCVGRFEKPKSDEGGGGGGGGGGGAGGNNLGGVLQRPDGFIDTYAYNPGWGSIFQVGNYNSSRYHGVVLELVRRQYRNWQMEASYTWSQAVGDAEDFASFLGDDSTTRDDEYGYLSYDQRHVVKVNATTITPWGFRMGATVQWQSGLPYSILGQRVTVDSVPPQYPGFVQAEPRVRLRYLTGQRNDQRNRGYWNIDVRLDKEFNLPRGVNLQLALDIYNLLNERVYLVYSPNEQQGSQINGFNQAFTTVGRRFQIGAKLSF